MVVVSATFFTLLLVPASIVIAEDLKAGARGGVRAIADLFTRSAAESH